MVAIIQRKTDMREPSTVTRVDGTKLKSGCSSQFDGHSVGTQPKPPIFQVTVPITNSAPPYSKIVCIKSVITTARKPPNYV